MQTNQFVVYVCQKRKRNITEYHSVSGCLCNMQGMCVWINNEIFLLEKFAIFGRCRCYFDCTMCFEHFSLSQFLFVSTATHKHTHIMASVSKAIYTLQRPTIRNVHDINDDDIYLGQISKYLISIIYISYYYKMCTALHNLTSAHKREMCSYCTQNTIHIYI